MQGLFHDVRHSIRLIIRNPSFSFIVILTIGLGIAVNTSVFSLIDSTLFRPLPFDRSEELAVIWSVHEQMGFSTSPSINDVVLWRENLNSFEYVEAYMPATHDLTGDGEPAQIAGAGVTADMFECLGVSPIRGRVFTPEDADGRFGNVVMISEGLWKRRFGTDADIVGRNVLLDGLEHTVIGVIPSWCKFPRDDTELWTPLDLAAPPQAGPMMGGVMVTARVRRGVSFEQADEELAILSKATAENSPGPAGMIAKVTPMVSLSNKLGSAISILLLAVGFVLLSACANVAGMMLARGLARQQETAIRISMGASNWRLLRKSMLENVVLAALGGALGLFLALWMSSYFSTLMPTGFLMPVKEIRLDGRLLLCVGGLVLLTTLLFGAAPAFQSLRVSLWQALRQSSASAGSAPSTLRTRRALLVGQIAICFVLVVSAGLLTRSFVRMINAPAGFRPDGLIAMKLDLAERRYSTDEQRLQFVNDLASMMKARPEWENVAISDGIPLNTWSQFSMPMIEGRNPVPQEARTRLSCARINENYFDVFGINLLEGRTFNSLEVEGGDSIVVISEALARRGWPGKSAIGGRLMMNGWYTVVGVVNDVRESSPQATNEHLQMYFPLGAMDSIPLLNQWVVARSGQQQTGGLAMAKQMVWSIDPEQPVALATTVDQLYGKTVARPRFTMMLVLIFALTATFLMAIGIFGVTAYAVARQTREIGIRAALGAQADSLVWAIVYRGFKMALIGICLGGLLSIGLSKVMGHLLFDTPTMDVMTYTLTIVTLLGVTALASYLPARRAARVDPMIALRQE